MKAPNFKQPDPKWRQFITREEPAPPAIRSLVARFPRLKKREMLHRSALGSLPPVQKALQQLFQHGWLGHDDQRDQIWLTAKALAAVKKGCSR